VAVILLMVSVIWFLCWLTICEFVGVVLSLMVVISGLGAVVVVVIIIIILL
jgi:hypothetical protein